ncbi:MAG TPA: hypothetical protein VGJ26_00320 [Pirellulales bacterium]|jgi:hypothetical protein
MSTEQLERDLAPLAQTLRKIVIVLLVSVVGMTVAMAFLRSQGKEGWNFSEGGVVTLTALAVAIAAPLLGTVISRQVVTTNRRKLATGESDSSAGQAKKSQKKAKEADIESLAMLYQTKTIILASILHGAAYFNAIAFMIEGDLLTIVAGGLLAVGIASQFPTVTRVANWVEDQLGRLQEDRAQSR